MNCLNPDYCGTGDADTICDNCKQKQDKELTFNGIPIHICDKAPKNKPFILNSSFARICPFCGEELKYK